MTKPRSSGAGRTPESRVSRRAALQTLAAGVGVGVTAPRLDAATLDHAHTAMAAPDEQAGAPTATAHVFFNDHQFETVQVLARLIVPGAEASGTPAFLDKLLAASDVDDRRRVVSALGAFDGAAMRAHGRAFKDVTPAQQAALLTQAATMASGPAATAWRSGDPIPTPGPAPEPANLRDYFDLLKGWIADIHFSSEPGLRELGWTGTLFFQRFNACGTSS
jgi:hypothetical protein